MICTKCGTQIPEGAGSCPECGTPVTAEDPAQVRRVPNLPRIPQDPLPERPAHNAEMPLWQKFLYGAIAAAVLILVLYLIRGGF